MRQLKFILPVFLLLLSAAFADVIHLRDGSSLEGEIISETEESITLKMRHGTVEVFKSKIREIEKKPLPAEVYRRRTAAIAPDDAEGHYMLALWCREKGLEREYVLELEKVIAIEPGHAAARRALGYVRKGDNWVKEKAEPAPAAPDPAKAVEIIKRALAAEPEQAELLIEKLRTFDGLPREAFHQCAGAIKKWRSYEPVTSGEQEVKFPKSGFACSVSVPLDYDGKKPVPVILTLHTSGESSEEVLRAWNASDAALRIKKDCILIAPQGETSYWWKPEVTAKLDVLIDEIKNTYNVDTNRFSLSGFSNGAHGAWHYGLRRPDTFAAIAPDSGLPLSTAGDRIDFASLQNALNLPVYVVNSKEDRIAPGQRVALVVRKLREAGCAEVVHKEFPGGRRIHAVEAWGELYKWLSKQVRNIFPKRIAIRYDGTGPSHAYWLELVDPKPGAKASARVRGNRIEVTASGAAKVAVYLSDEMLDLDEKVTVRVNNRRVYLDLVKRSPATALETCLARSDRHLTYAAKLSFDLK